MEPEERYVLLARRLLEQLCGQASVSAEGQGIEETASLVEGMLQTAGFSTRRLSIPGAPPIVYGEQAGSEPASILLYNHYDVQPAEPLDLWESPPFVLNERGGKLFARGVADNKGQIAARLAAIQALRDAAGQLPLTVRWVIEGEEEVGSPHFGEIIAPHADALRADGALWEGSGFDDEGRPHVSLGTKGLLYVQLTARAMDGDAHSGNAAILPSAAWRLVQALASLRDLSGRILIPGFYDDVLPPTAEQRQSVEDLPDQDGELKRIFGVDRFIDDLSGSALRERASFSPTCNIAGLSSGYSGPGVKTVLPAAALAKLDFRLVPNQEPGVVHDSLRHHLADGGYGDVRVEVLGAAEPMVTPMDDPFIRRVIDLSTQFNGNRAAISPLLSGTLPLLGPLRRYVGLPGLSAPDNVSYLGSRAHAPNEHIRVADLARGVAFIMHLLQGLGARIRS